MNELWGRLESLFEAHAPTLLPTLRPPASAQQIEAAERTMGISFTEDLRAAYLRHDGAADETMEHRPFFFHYGAWCSLERMLEKWHSMCDLVASLKDEPGGDDQFPVEDDSWADLEVRPEYWNRHRIPVSRTNTINSLYVDLQPGPAGVRGQLLQDSGAGEPLVIARSLNEYLGTMADRIEQGLLAWDNNKGWVNASTGTTVLEWKSMWGR
ncbi:SMI1/KNR4 family protein [Caldimonas brevitalea]|uniref:Glucan synthase 1-related protein n=1 Tax=Caldimonas brevitalea TaxID=413882 RepID=A0A0G3BR94_9BURK|nr:SMI1/KNR4 family protein [Caldimonas brevitalea]AKJ31944.1 glucan synthase 1-related protein [Caldimonas brevitalea]